MYRPKMTADRKLLMTRRCCIGKVAHGTAQRATLAAYHMEEKKPGERFEVYRCKYCLSWHVGHPRRYPKD